jgi:hypothetical protein
MEVAKLILNTVKNKAHMTLSVKPFGCMPSSGVSDGVQSVITERFPEAIFCAVETSGDGAVNFYSRVQMYLFKAKQVAHAEVEKALIEAGLTNEQFAEYLKQHPRIGHPLHHPAHAAGCTTADLVHEVADRLQTPTWKRGLRTLKKAGTSAGSALASAAKNAPAAAKVAAGASVELVELVRDRGPEAGHALLAMAKEHGSRILPFAERKEGGGVAAAAGG